MVSRDPNDSKHWKPLPVTCPKCGKETLRWEHDCTPPSKVSDEKTIEDAQARWNRTSISTRESDGELLSVWIWINDKGVSASKRPDRMHDAEYVPISKIKEAERERDESETKECDCWARLGSARQLLTEAQSRAEKAEGDILVLQDVLAIAQEESRTLRRALDEAFGWIDPIDTEEKGDYESAAIRNAQIIIKNALASGEEKK